MEEQSKEKGKTVDEEEEEPGDAMFRVVIEKPDPKLVKLSRKNVAFITITHDKELENE